MTASLAVIVVTHETREHTIALLGSLARDPSYSSWEPIVIDNASTDGTRAAIAERWPSVRIVRNEPQRGFAGAVNQGVRSTTAPVAVAVNPDAVVPVGTFDRLLEVLGSDERIAAVGPLIRFPDGKVQRHGMSHPSPYTAAVILLGLADVPFFRREAERYYGRHDPGPPADVDSLTGACLMFRRNAYDSVGPFDERFFLYCEDVDWSLRARAAGWRLVFVPSAEIAHEKATVSKGRSAFMIRHYYRSLRAFYGKHHAPGDLVPIRALWYLAAYVMEASALITNALRRRKGLHY